MAAQIQCPKGHALPRSTKYGECTPVHCAGTSKNGSLAKTYTVTHKAKRDLIKTIKTDATSQIAQALEGLDETQKRVATEAASEEATTLAHLTGRRAARQQLYKIPENLEGADAEEHVQKNFLRLAPYAVAEIEHQLLYGDDAQRRDAARDVLDAVGMRKKEGNGGGSGATIILNLGGKELPWAQKVVTSVVGNGSTSLNPQTREDNPHAEQTDLPIEESSMEDG